MPDRATKWVPRAERQRSDDRHPVPLGSRDYWRRPIQAVSATCPGTGAGVRGVPPVWTRRPVNDTIG